MTVGKGSGRMRRVILLVAMAMGCSGEESGEEPHETLPEAGIDAGGEASSEEAATDAAPDGPEAQHYEATKESLNSHPVPPWFHDAKLGIMVHWGLYSVPAWAPPVGELQDIIAEPDGWTKWFAENPYAEWYFNSIRIEGSPSAVHHAQTYGDAFAYREFASQFEQGIDAWDPESWAHTFASAGARYVVFVTKHHDGFALWPTQRQSPEHGVYSTSRDCVGELTEAVRDHGMRMGLYYSGGIDWTFHAPVGRDLGDLLESVPQTPEYIEHANAQWRELIERYRPEVLWNDIGYPSGASAKQLIADYYNLVPEGVVNDRFNQYELQHYDFATKEYDTVEDISEEKFESTRGLGYSFGYNQLETAEHMVDVDALVDLLIDVVSKNGNLLVNVGPMADGTLPPLQRERLEGLGSWLGVHGTGIYGTRPWTRAEGETESGGRVRFTRSADALYLFLLDAEAGEVVVRDLEVPPGTTVSWVGEQEELAWHMEGKNLVVPVPDGAADGLAASLRFTPGW